MIVKVWKSSPPNCIFNFYFMSRCQICYVSGIIGKKNTAPLAGEKNLGPNSWSVISNRRFVSSPLGCLFAVSSYLNQSG